MSPILTRPVREQFEHDRIIRLLQDRYRRKFEVAINPGAEQNSSVAIGEQTVFPDLVLFGQEKSHRLQGTIEVETGESVNTLEAMSQWARFSRLRAPFMLYVPPQALDTARRLCVEHNISVSEIWTYHTALDQVRFTMVHRSATAPKSLSDFDDMPTPTPTPKPATAAAVKPAAAAAVKPAAAAKSVPAASVPAAKTAKPSKPVTPAKPAKPAAKTTKAAKPAAKVAAKKAAPKVKPKPPAKAKGAKKATATKASRPAKRR